MEKDDGYFKNIRDFVYILFLLTFVSGFLIWHIFLDTLGFEEIQLIQSKYILTGFLFFIFCLFIFLIVYGVLNCVKKFHIFYAWLRVKSNKIFIVVISIAILFLYFVFIEIFTYYIFPRISSTFGGGQPRVVSLIADKDMIEYFNNFDVPISPNSGVKPAVQTANLCIGYENEGSVLLLLSNRILSLKKENIRGFGSIPTKLTDSYNEVCKTILESWLYKKQLPKF